MTYRLYRDDEEINKYSVHTDYQMASACASLASSDGTFVELRNESGKTIEVWHNMECVRARIATIETDSGTMTVYYNGTNEYLTAESADMIEAIEDGNPTNIKDAIELVKKLYPANSVWATIILSEGVEVENND